MNSVRLHSARLKSTSELEVRGDPRIQVTTAHLAARQAALLSLYVRDRFFFEADLVLRGLKE